MLLKIFENLFTLYLFKKFPFDICIQQIGATLAPFKEGAFQFEKLSKRCLEMLYAKLYNGVNSLNKFSLVAL